MKEKLTSFLYAFYMKIYFEMKIWIGLGNRLDKNTALNQY